MRGDLTPSGAPCCRPRRRREEVTNPMQYYAPNWLAVPRIQAYRSYYVTANTFLSVAWRYA